jgi:alpha-methylacyl-CoA racemase
MERLGVGPEVCLARNPKLVFGRMTGWGQEGPYASSAGHDINYIALAGALAHFGRAGEPPTPPLNMVGDFGGGGMLLAFGVVCALLEAQRSGKGQVIDAAMVDGSAVLMSMFWAYRNVGMFDEHARGVSLLDTGAHFYDVFECADGEWVSVGSIEPQFYALLLEKTGLTGDPEFTNQMDKTQWSTLKRKLAKVFKTKTQSQWNEIMEGTDVCYAPVLRMSEAAQHPHNVARNTFIEVAGVTQPAPAPRYSRSATDLPTAPAHAGQHTRAVLGDWGVDAVRIDTLISSGAIRQA